MRAEDATGGAEKQFLQQMNEEMTTIDSAIFDVSMRIQGAMNLLLELFGEEGVAMNRQLALYDGEEYRLHQVERIYLRIPDEIIMLQLDNESEIPYNELDLGVQDELLKEIHQGVVSELMFRGMSGNRDVH